MRCKQGDLAYIIKALRPENVGKVVQCVECIGFHERFQAFGLHGETWVSPDSDYLWVIKNSGSITTLYGPAKEAVIPDSWLRPIKADPSDTLDEDIAEDSGKELVYNDER
jgi:hypothetical protein